MGRNIARGFLAEDKPNSETHEAEIVTFIADLLLELVALAEHEINNEETRKRILDIIATLEGGLICRNPKSLC